MFKVRAPQTQSELNDYYELRWRILRAPWQQPPGSERDQQDDNAIHAMAMNENEDIVGVARLHQIDKTTAQIRYMAVAEHCQHKGVGEALLRYLEEKAKALGVRIIKLNARENSVGFYTKLGYQIIGPGHVLYGEIKHQKLEKRFA